MENKSNLDLKIDEIDGLLDQANDLLESTSFALDQFPEALSSDYEHLFEQAEEIAEEMHSVISQEGYLGDEETDFNAYGDLERDERDYEGFKSPDDFDEANRLISNLVGSLQECKDRLISHEHEDYGEYSDHQIESQVSDEPDEDNEIKYECTALDTCQLCGDERTITYVSWADADEPDGSDLIDGLSGYGEITDEGEWDKDTNKEVIAYRASQAKEGEPINE